MDKTLIIPKKRNKTSTLEESIMELFREDGRKAGLYDICDWWIETYPPDVFVNEPKPIVEARMCMQNILIKRVRAGPSSNKILSTLKSQ